MKRYINRQQQEEEQPDNVYVEDSCYLTVGNQLPKAPVHQKPIEQPEHRYWDTQKAPEKPIKKTICSVHKIDSIDVIGDDSKKGMLGFYIPEKNIFVPCESKEQYFYLKRKIMEKKAKEKPPVSGYCFENKLKPYNKLNNCWVPLDNGELYDLNSCQMDRVEFM